MVFVLTLNLGHEDAQANTASLVPSSKYTSSDSQQKKYAKRKS